MQHKIAKVILIGLLVTIIALVGMMAGILYRLNTAAAQDWPAFTDETKLDLARCIRAEADSSSADRAPIAFTLIRRYEIQRRGWSYHETIRRYCAIFDERAAQYYSSRARRIRASTFEEPLHGKPEEWQELRDFVDRFAARRVPDPCPASTQWGGNIDKIPRSWIQVDCGETANRYYREPR